MLHVVCCVVLSCVVLWVGVVYISFDFLIYLSRHTVTPEKNPLFCRRDVSVSAPAPAPAAIWME